MFAHLLRRKLPLAAILAVLIVSTKLAASETQAKSNPRPTSSRSALQSESLGLFSPDAFRIITGKDCKDCPTPKQALWYFQEDLIAVPKKGFSAAGLATRSAGYANIFHALQVGGPPTELSHPSLIWIGSPEMIKGTNLSSDGKTLWTNDGAKIAFSLVPKIFTNRSYYNESTTEFFRQRSLRVRGARHTENGAKIFVARTIWPEDFRIDAATLLPTPLRRDDGMTDLMIAESGGATAPFETRLLWERALDQERNWAGRPVLGLLLSGGQGDDDESQGGHLAVVTGRIGSNGEVADWMVNNFYNLDETSEKGIIASMLPLDNYLMDLNSGQSYYRPTYLLVAVLQNDRAASRFQAAIEPVYNHFYRHDFLYHHSKANCAGISIDTLRAIGWQVPRKGASSYLTAAVAFTYLSIKDLSPAGGKKMFDYLTEEQTRLFPRAAFEAVAEDLLALVNRQVESTGRSMTAYERTLREDVDAVLFIRIPQIPSSRAFGTCPVASFDEYRNRVPADRSQWKIVPVDPRPFPEALKEPLGGEERAFNWHSMATLLGLVALGGIAGLWRMRNLSGSEKSLLNYPFFSPKNR